MFSFQNSEYLLGLAILIPLVLLFFFVLRWKKIVARKIGDEELVKNLTSGYSSKYFALKFFALLAAIAACIISAANLRSPQAGTTGNKAGVDIMIALDVSNSMLAQDVKPNRLERAKQVLNKLIGELDNNRVGFVVFAGQAFLQMPLTADLASAKMFVANASPNAIPVQGTVISDALRLCNASLDTKEKKYKAIILITDGEGHDEKIESAIDEISEFGVVVHTVGIGSPDGAPIFDEAANDYKKDLEGNTVISKLNEQQLQLIASKTGGKYFLFDNADNVSGKLITELSQMEKKQIGGGDRRTYTTYFHWFLIFALILLLLEIIIPERKMKWLSVK